MRILPDSGHFARRPSPLKVMADKLRHWILVGDHTIQSHISLKYLMWDVIIGVYVDRICADRVGSGEDMHTESWPIERSDG